MKRGKAYQDAAKQFDRTQLYEPVQALQIVNDIAKAKFDETVEVHIKLGSIPATLTSRSEERSACRTEPAKPGKCWYSPKGKKLKRLKMPEPILSVPKNLPKGFRAAGSTSMLRWLHRT